MVEQPEAPATEDRFATRDVARLIGVDPRRVRELVHAGLCRPRRLANRHFRFNFQDLVLLRTAQGLLEANIPVRRVRRALSELTKQLPSDQPLTGVRIGNDGKDVVVRKGGSAWDPSNGQLVFDFDVLPLARSAKAFAATNKTVTPDFAGDASEWFERGLEREQRGDMVGAGAAYDRTLALDPQFADAYVNLGRLEHQQGKLREAAQFYGKAISMQPDDAIAHYNMAIALEDLERVHEAIGHYQDALRTEPKFADAHFNLARVLDRVGRRTQALRHLLTYKKLTKRK